MADPATPPPARPVPPPVSNVRPLPVNLGTLRRIKLLGKIS